jgi:thymidylate synthase (FAD)
MVMDSKGDFGSSVTLIAHTDNPLFVIEYAGRVCYDTQHRTGDVDGWIMKRIQQGHESLIEHASATFEIVASRVFTHQLVRHRIASYSQRSTRYVDEDQASYVNPPMDAYPQEIFRDAMAWAGDFYMGLIKNGVPREYARYVLPMALQSKIIVTMNFRELRHFIKLRTDRAASPEMQEVAGKVKEICQAKWPEVFGDL